MADFQQHRSFWVTFFLTTTFKPPINCGDDIQVKDKKIVKIEEGSAFEAYLQLKLIVQINYSYKKS